MIQPNDLAYPSDYKMEYGNEDDIKYQSCGLTKREYFAAMAMQGLLTSGMNVYKYDEVASVSVLHADELIKQLNETTNTSPTT
jgi:hypothetical protein